MRKPLCFGTVRFNEISPICKACHFTEKCRKAIEKNLEEINEMGN